MPFRFVKGFRSIIKEIGEPASRRRHRDWGKPIKRLHTNLLAATLAPLVLGGCIMPVAVQIASIFADVVSLMTTDKTLSDHGLSAATNRDCAVWRVLDGEEICRDYEPGAGPVMVADADSDAKKAAEALPWRPVEASSALVDADDMAGIGVSPPTPLERRLEYLFRLCGRDDSILLADADQDGSFDLRDSRQRIEARFVPIQVPIGEPREPMARDGRRMRERTEHDETGDFAIDGEIGSDRAPQGVAHQEQLAGVHAALIHQPAIDSPGVSIQTLL